jgi:hypothetical protein
MTAAAVHFAFRLARHRCAIEQHAFCGRLNLLT